MLFLFAVENVERKKKEILGINFHK
jgi:hypothetical protein